MTTSLFGLTGEALLLQARIESTSEGLFAEDPDQVAHATAALEELITAESGNRKAMEAKADAWCWVIDSLRSRATMQREHADRLCRLADEAERRAQALQEQLVHALLRISPTSTSWNLPEHKLVSRASTVVDLEGDLDASDLPEEYRRTKTSVSIDKAAIKAALKAGTAIRGAQLLERRSWRIV